MKDGVETGNFEFSSSQKLHQEAETQTSTQ